MHASREILEPLARKYVWWKTPDEALAWPERIITQVMDVGDYADVQALATQAGDAVLTDALMRAEVGAFSPRSWAYWHYRLGLANAGCVPPMPARRTG